MKECLLCDNECESVSHVLWECPAYRENFLVALQGMLGDEFEHFEALGSFEKASFMLGSESWVVLCLTLLRVILDVWELRKVRLYGDSTVTVSDCAWGATWCRWRRG